MKTKQAIRQPFAILLVICCCLVSRCGATTGSAAAASANLTMLHLYDDDNAGNGIEELELELLMESGSTTISVRMLQAGSKNVLATLSKNVPAYGCGRGKNYCLPDKDNRKLYCDARSRTAGCHLPK